MDADKYTLYLVKIQYLFWSILNIHLFTIGLVSAKIGVQTNPPCALQGIRASSAGVPSHEGG
jgi:hypothetical protein